MTVTYYRDIVQGSDQWLEARRGIITASNIGNLITKRSADALTVDCYRCDAIAGDPCTSASRKIPTPIKTVHDERASTAAQLPPVYEVADNDTSRNLTLTLAAERITGHIEYQHPSFDMQRGTEDEPWARLAYDEHHAPVEEVGFVTLETPDYKIGYSPDGLVGDDGLIEIKSRRAQGQLIAILSDRVPNANMAQLQCGMFVTGRKWVDYVSYSAGLPLYVKRVYPDPEWHAAIEAAATIFEINVTDTITRYKNAAHLLPATERRPELDEIRI